MPEAFEVGGGQTRVVMTPRLDTVADGRVQAGSLRDQSVQFRCCPRRGDSASSRRPPVRMGR
jgi:hypothetical protein